MDEITLPADVAAAILSAHEPVSLVGPDGQLIAVVSPRVGAKTPEQPIFTPEEIAAAEQELLAGGPGITTAEMLQMLRERSAPRR